MQRIRFGLMAGLLVGALAAPVRAQTSLELGPSVGIYMPLTSYQGPIAGNNPFNGAPFTGIWTQDNAGSYGLEADLWSGSRWGVAGSWLHAASGVTRSLTSFGSRSPAHVDAATLEAELRLGPARPRFQLVGSAGLGYLAQGGEAFDSVGSQHHAAMVVGLGSRVRVTSRLVVLARLRSLLYSAHLEDRYASYDSSLQADLFGQLFLAYQVF